MLKTRMKTVFLGFSVLFFILFSSTASCNNNLSWDEFISQLRTEALADNIRPEVFDDAFQNIRGPSSSVLHFDKTQPEKRLSFLQYRNTRVDQYRIQLGRKELMRNRSVLNNINQQFGVSPCFILSIWGLETSYGRYRGNFPVIQSLATLTYSPRRSAFFHNELRIALRMLNDGQVDLRDFKGEWAGASGHCQFMPSTWVKYGVAYDGKGNADIWNNTNDAFASIANFLLQNGWHPDEPWAIQVTIPENFNDDLLSITTTKTVREWFRLGVQPINSYPLNKNWHASIIYPDGGPAYMVFDNFKTLLKWNRSNYYVASLGYLAEQICQQQL